MNKKILGIIFTSFLFLLISFRIVHSQTPSATFDFNKAYQDYVYNTQLYNNSYSAYQLARSTYLASKTIIAQTNAQVATLDMLQARDQMIMTYLTAIRMRLRETTGISEGELQLKYSEIDADFKWWEDHKTKLASAASLDDLVDDSNEAYDHYQLTLLLTYQSLSTIFIGRLDSERSDLQRIVSELKNKVAEIKANQNKNTSTIERSLIEVDNRIDRSMSKESEAKDMVSSMGQDQNNSRESNDKKFSDVKTTLRESLAYMNETVTILNQIILNIKTAD